MESNKLTCNSCAVLPVCKQAKYFAEVFEQTKDIGNDVITVSVNCSFYAKLQNRRVRCKECENLICKNGKTVHQLNNKAANDTRHGKGDFACKKDGWVSAQSITCSDFQEKTKTD